MRYPDVAFLPDDKDVRTGMNPQRVAQRHFEAHGLAARSLETDPVPKDRVFVLTGLVVTAATAGVEHVTSVICAVLDPVANVVFTFHKQRGGAGIFTIDREEHEYELVVMPGERLQINGSYSGAVAGNSLEVSFSGYLVPRANYQFGGFGVTFL